MECLCHRANTFILISEFKKKGITITCALLSCQPISFPLGGNCHPKFCIYYYFFNNLPHIIVSLNNKVFSYTFLKLFVNGWIYFVTYLTQYYFAKIYSFSAQWEFIDFSLFYRFPLKEYNKLFIYYTVEWTFRLFLVCDIIEGAAIYILVHVSW